MCVHLTDLARLTHLALIFLTHLAGLVSLTHLAFILLAHLADLPLAHLAVLSHLAELTHLAVLQTHDHDLHAE